MNQRMHLIILYWHERYSVEAFAGWPRLSSVARIPLRHSWRLCLLKSLMLRSSTRWALITASTWPHSKIMEALSRCQARRADLQHTVFTWSKVGSRTIHMYRMLKFWLQQLSNAWSYACIRESALRWQPLGWSILLASLKDFDCRVA